MAMNRTTTATVRVKRYPGKISLEEAVGSPHFDALCTYPRSQVVLGCNSMNCSDEFMKDVHDRLHDVNSRLQSMNQTGIGYSIISITTPGIEGVFNADTAVELAQKTNDAIHKQYCAPHPDRFGFFCSIPLQKPDEAAKELERCVTKLGAKGVLVNGFTNISEKDVNKVRYLDEPENEPFWAMLEKLDVPLYIHPRCPPPDQQRVYRGYPNLCSAGYGFGTETAAHSLRIMCSGVLDRYPKVQIILGHCAEALPFMIHRIDHRMMIAIQGTNGPYKKTLMEYFQQNFYATTSGVRRESTLRNTLEEMGESRVLFSVDYPYESGEDTADWFDHLELNEHTKAAVAFGNARKLFKMD